MFKEYSKNFTDYTPAFKQMGMQIISFATKEPKLFKFLFIILFNLIILDVNALGTANLELVCEKINIQANDKFKSFNDENIIGLYDLKTE
mgnify:CR=1 FL=1